jgi:hypothetical protein
MLHLSYFKSAILQRFSKTLHLSIFQICMHPAAVSKFRHLAGDFTKLLLRGGNQIHHISAFFNQ